ncbi:MAG: hypothetical protein H0U71_04455 [Gammaproteobacteria bacterium]|nr:hypothetical protein [Gammaproteobacteria bacterium]
MSRSLLSLILLIILTLLMVFWQMMGFYVLHLFSTTYSFLMHALQPLVPDHAIREILVILIGPLLLALIPVFIYWIFRRRWLYEYMTVVWCIWLVMMTMVMIKQGHHV